MSKFTLTRRNLLKAGAATGVALAAPMHFVRGAYAAEFCNMPAGDTVTLGFNVPQSGPYPGCGQERLQLGGH